MSHDFFTSPILMSYSQGSEQSNNPLNPIFVAASYAQECKILCMSLTGMLAVNVREICVHLSVRECVWTMCVRASVRRWERACAAA